MKTFATLDYAVVVLYLIAVGAVGSSFYRRKSSAQEYFLGGRSFSWIPIGISMVAADLSAVSVMGVPAWTFRHNFELAWTLVGYLAMTPIFIRVFVPFYGKLNLYTAYEYLEKRFNLGVRLIASALFQTLRGVHVAIALYAPSLVINLVTGMPAWQCIAFMGLFTTLYTTLGGMKAVIWTDVIQFSAVTIGILLIFGTSVAHVPGGVAGAYAAAQAAGHLRFLNFSHDPSEVTSFWACVIGGSTLVLTTMATDQAVLQRLYTARSIEDCKQSAWLQALVNVPTSLLLYSAGIGLFAFYHYHPERMAGLTSQDAVLPFFVVRELPAGLSGLVVAAIFAASMAVMSAGINSLTTASVIDFYRGVFRPSESAEHYAFAGRVGTALWGLTATALALLADRLGELAIAYNRVNSAVGGPLLGIFLLGALTRRANSAGVLAGAAAGACAVAVVFFRTDWSFFYHGVIGVVVTFGVGYVASLFGPRPSPETVRNYVMSRKAMRA
jgi:SSS family transporter